MLPAARPPEPETEPEDEPLPELEPDTLPEAPPRSRSETEPEAEPLPLPEAEPDALQPARAIVASISVVANNFFPSIPCTSLHRIFWRGRAGSINVGKRPKRVNKMPWPGNLTELIESARREAQD